MSVTLAVATRPDPDVFEHAGVRITIADIVQWIETTGDDAWQTDVVRSADGKRNCFFGHLYDLGGARARGANLTDDETIANRLWEWFEEQWASTFFLYPINDGPSAAYPQATPRLRILALLADLRDGRVLRTPQSMEADFLAGEEAGHA